MLAVIGKVEYRTIMYAAKAFAEVELRVDMAI